jgi:hypothetical protein
MSLRAVETVSLHFRVGLEIRPVVAVTAQKLVAHFRSDIEGRDLRALLK